MSSYRHNQRVEIFDADLQKYVAATVTFITAFAVGVSRDDRMFGEMVDPADSHKIRPLEVTA